MVTKMEDLAYQGANHLNIQQPVKGAIMPQNPLLPPHSVSQELKPIPVVQQIKTETKFVKHEIKQEIKEEDIKREPCATPVSNMQVDEVKLEFAPNIKCENPSSLCSSAVGMPVNVGLVAGINSVKSEPAPSPCAATPKPDMDKSNRKGMYFLEV